MASNLWPATPLRTRSMTCPQTGLPSYPRTAPSSGGTCQRRRRHSPPLYPFRDLFASGEKDPEPAPGGLAAQYDHLLTVGQPWNVNDQNNNFSGSTRAPTAGISTAIHRTLNRRDPRVCQCFFGHQQRHVRGESRRSRRMDPDSTVYDVAHLCLLLCRSRFHPDSERNR